jgi:hypothetical protein
MSKEINRGGNRNFIPVFVTVSSADGWKIE